MRDARCTAVTYLRLQQRQESTSDQGLAIKRGAKMVRVIAAGGDISDPQERAKCILQESAKVGREWVRAGAHIIQTVGGEEV